MKGLLVKDLRLMKNQRQFFLSILVIALVFALAGQNLYFVVSYCTLVAAFFTLSTISYDEYNNGFFYLFTMPISRREYAVEKYLLVLIVGGGTWLLITTAVGIYTWIQNPQTNMLEWLIGAASAFVSLLGVIAVLLPVQLKVGAEKSRIAAMLVSFGIFGAAMLIGRIVKSTRVNLDFHWISKIGTAGWSVIGFAGFVSVILISLVVSIRIMEKKKF